MTHLKLGVRMGVALAVALWCGGAGAVDVNLRPQGDVLTRAVQVALASLSTRDLPIALKTATGPTLTLGGVGVSAAPFNPDVIARVVVVGSERRIEFNPQGPVPLQQAVQQALAAELKLTAWTPQAAALAFGGADLNRDGVVDLSDLAILMASYGATKASAQAANPVGDLNGDGRVNDTDVRLFGEQYAAPPAPPAPPTPPTPRP